MGKQKRRLTAAEKAEKRRRRQEYMTVFINGKQKRVRRPPKIDGMDVEEFIRNNADPVWLHQNEMWEYLDAREEKPGSDGKNVPEDAGDGEDRLGGEHGDDIPF